ncbi:hypothetical protein [Enterobacter ludwigii]|uniref:hypothetical protein n=1 Tax=Enterobacter ludwigii TaxID=299767 RepID=UPI003F70FD03
MTERIASQTLTLALLLYQQSDGWVLLPAVMLPAGCFLAALRPQRCSIRLWLIPVLLISAGVVLLIPPGGGEGRIARGTAARYGESNGRDTRCDRPERSGVVLTEACQGLVTVSLRTANDRQGAMR